MTAIDRLLARARSATGQHTVYWIGTGGLDPTAALPSWLLPIGRLWPTLDAADQARFLPQAQAAGIDVHNPDTARYACDCSGFVCWALGFARESAGGLWTNTDSIWEDATGPQRRFESSRLAEPGMLVVYPKKGSHENFGHVGIVMAVDDQGRATLVAHCSADNFNSDQHDAIQVTGPGKFAAQPLSLYARYRDLG